MKKVDSEILQLYYKYDKDLSLLNEPWAKKKDKESVTLEQSYLLGEYIKKLEFLNTQSLSENLKNEALSRIKELERNIEMDVIEHLKNEILDK